MVDMEHVRHLFVECQFARHCWANLGGDFETSVVEILSTWMLDMLGTETDSKLVRLTEILWGIWLARNKRVWEEKNLSPGLVMEISSRMVTEWQAAQHKSNSMVQSRAQVMPTKNTKWIPPGWHNVNVDAAIHEGAATFKIGMVLRSADGDFVAGWSTYRDEKVLVLEAEAI